MSPPESSGLRLFVDRMSQPSRTVLVFCRAAGILFQEVTVNIGKGEQRKPEFLAVNPLGKLPAMQEGDFCLPESSSIMRYLCDTCQPGGQLADHWYPREAQARARVDSALSWHGSSLRIGSMVVVWNRAISLSLGFPGNEALVEAYGMPQLQMALNALEGVWLRDGPFVAGQRQVSIADLLLSCEVEQLCLLDGAAQGPTMAELLAPHPRTQAWLQRVRDACAPHYEEVHGLLRKSRGRLVARRQQQRQEGSSKL